MRADHALAGFQAEMDPPAGPSEVVGYRVRRDREVRGFDDPRKGTRSALDTETFTPVPVDARGKVVPR